MVERCVGVEDGLELGIAEEKAICLRFECGLELGQQFSDGLGGDGVFVAEGIAAGGWPG